MKLEFKILICVIVIILITSVIFIFSSIIGTKNNTIDLNELQAQAEEIANRLNLKAIDGCCYKKFDPGSDSANNFLWKLEEEKMQYSNKIYYIKINTYDEYIEYQNNFPEIIKMTESDFKDYYILFTAIENISMEKIIPTKVKFENDKLNIDFGDSNNENDFEKVCTVFMIPREFDTNTFELQKIEKDPLLEEFEGGGTSTEGLEHITEDEALKSWQEYRENTLKWGENDYPVVVKIEEDRVRPNNHFKYLPASDYRQAEYYRDAYIIYLSTTDGFSNCEVYIDKYTGKVIGGYEHGV